MKHDSRVLLRGGLSGSRLRAALVGTSIIALTLCTCCSSAEMTPAPTNDVTIMIDGSGSYRSRQSEAIKRSVGLLDTMKEAKIHRWEPTSDKITVITVDAMPDILWSGTLKELKACDPAGWAARFRARTDYAGCTDIGGAFRLWVQYLAASSPHMRKYLIVFSDLIDEPPTDSIRRCRRAKRLPPDDFPWEAFQEVSVSVFWMPPDQKLAWQRAVNERGLKSHFALYTVSESEKIVVSPPPRAKFEITETARKAQRKRLGGWVKMLGMGFVGVCLAIVLIPVGVLALRWHRRRRGLVGRDL